MIAPVDGTPTVESNALSQKQFVTFWVNEQLMGIPVGIVQEVLNPQTIASVPLAPREIAGLLNLRGQIVTAINLRRRLGLPDYSQSEGSMNVVLRYRGESFSLLVDSVGDVLDIAEMPIEAPPRTISSTWKAYTEGVIRLERNLLLLLNVTAILAIGGPLKSEHPPMESRP